MDVLLSTNQKSHAATDGDFQSSVTPAVFKFKHSLVMSVSGYLRITELKHVVPVVLTLGDHQV